MKLSPHKLAMASRHKRLATLLSLDDVQGLAHHCVAASCLLEELRVLCACAADNGGTLDPGHLLAFLEENAPQLNLATFKPEASDGHHSQAS